VTARRLPVRGYALSTLVAYAEERWHEDAPEIEAACAALRAGGGSALLVAPEEALLVASGLVELSNTEDEDAEREARLPVARRDPERLRHLRAACSGLSTLAVQVARLAAR
jgi:hypothetical protein